MNSLNKVVIFFAILAVAGAGLAFFPSSPVYYKNFIVVVTPEQEEELTAAIEDAEVSNEEAESSETMN